MKKLSKNFSKYLIELLIVAFGVFLGMYVSEWNSNKKTRTNTIKSLNYLVEELEANQQSLRKSIDYHSLIKSNLEKLTESLEEKDFSKSYFESEVFHITKIDQWTGVGLPKFETISYEGAKINGVFQEVDFEITHLISDAYKQISLQQEFGKSIMDKLIQANSNTKVIDVVVTLETLTSDLLNMANILETNLIAKVKKLKDYQNKYK